MKRVGYLYEKMADKHLIREVILKGAKGKKKRKDVKEVLADVDGYTDKIYDLVITESYFPTKPRKKLIHDKSSGKERLIAIVPYYPDGIMHQLVTEVLKPVFMKGMYRWSCASIPNRGNKCASDYVKRALRNRKGTKYSAKLDIHHYYPSINIDTLISMLERRVKDKRIIKLVRMIIESDDGPGLSIGFYINQWLANFYLQDLDHEILRMDGLEYYVRQMDDLVIMGPNKRKLRRAVQNIKQYLSEIGLTLNKSWQVFKTDSRGVDFVGYRVFHGYVIMRRRNFLKLARQSRRLQKSKDISFHDAAGMLSRAGQLKHCNGFNIRRKYVDPIKIHNLKEIVRKEARNRKMKNAIVIDANEIKKILAEKFGVPESDVIKSQYSYTVILSEKSEAEEK